MPIIKLKMRVLGNKKKRVGTLNGAKSCLRRLHRFKKGKNKELKTRRKRMK